MGPATAVPDTDHVLREDALDILQVEDVHDGVDGGVQVPDPEDGHVDMGWSVQILQSEFVLNLLLNFFITKRWTVGSHMK